MRWRAGRLSSLSSYSRIDESLECIVYQWNTKSEDSKLQPENFLLFSLERMASAMICDAYEMQKLKDV